MPRATSRKTTAPKESLFSRRWMVALVMAFVSLQFYLVSNWTSGTSFSDDLTVDTQDAVDHLNQKDEIERQPTETSGPGLPFSHKNPLLVLGLPHNGEVALNRYFRCAGYDESELGRYWTRSKNRKPIGECISHNMKKNISLPLTGCGNFSVWTQTDYIEDAVASGKKVRKHRECYFPTLDSTFIDQVALHYSQRMSTIQFL